MTDELNTNEEVVINEDAYAAKNRDLVARLNKANADKLALENQLADSQAETGTELAKAQRAQQRAETELARITGLYEEQGKQFKGVVLANQIDKAMDAANVLPHMRVPLAALYMSQVEWDSESGTGTINGKPVDAAVKAQLSSKEAAHYVAAPETGGAGAEGNTSTKATDKWADLSKVSAENGNVTEYISEAVKDRDAFNARATAAGRTDLLV